MKEILLQYAQYNVWANKRIIDTLLQQQESVLDKQQISSFPTLRATVLHMWGAENIWLQRLRVTEQQQWVVHSFTGTFEEACANWQNESQQLLKLVELQPDDNAFRQIVTYRDMKGNEYNNPVHEVLQHVFNHATYHRGQLVTMLRGAGVTVIPGTDFIGFIRMKGM